MPAHQYYIKYLSILYTKRAAVTDTNYGVMNRAALVNAMQNVPNVAGGDRLLLLYLALDEEFYTISTVLMESGASGLSTNPTNVVKNQQVSESKSAKCQLGSGRYTNNKRSRIHQV
jgi:hypothetical protein